MLFSAKLDGFWRIFFLFLWIFLKITGQVELIMVKYNKIKRKLTGGTVWKKK